MDNRLHDIICFIEQQIVTTETKIKSSEEMIKINADYIHVQEWSYRKITKYKKDIEIFKEMVKYLESLA